MHKRIICILAAVLLIVNISACSGNGKKDDKVDTIAMADIPSYEEKEIGAAIGLKIPGEKLSVDSKNRLVIFDREEKDGKYLFVDGGGNKAAELKCGFPGDGSLYALDSHNNLFVVTQQHKSQAEGDKSFQVTYQLISYSSKGEKLSSVDLGTRTVNNEKPGITDVAVDSKGNAYLLSQRENIEVMGPDGKKIKDIPANKIAYIEIDSRDNLILGAFDGGNARSRIEKRNLKGDSIWNIDLDPGNLMRQLKYDSKNDTIYILCEKGIIACTNEGKVKGYVLDFKQTSLLESGIFINDIAVDAEKNIYVLAFQADSSSGTHASKPLLYRYSALKEGQRPKDQAVLTLAVAYSDRFIESAVSKFQKDHPGVKVDIKDYKAAYMSTSEGGLSDDEIQRADKATEDFQRINTTEIMAGKGADIVEVGSLPYRKYIAKNALVNLSEWMANDREFDINKYNQKILNACKYKGNLYILPVSFSFVMLGGNKSILEKEGIKIDDTNWTWSDFFKIAQAVTKDTNGDGKPDQYALPKMAGTDEIFDYMFNSNKFIDYDKKTASFDSKEFVDLLELSKTISGYKIYNPQVDSDKLWEMTDPGTIAFVNEYISSYQSLIFAQALSNGEVVFLNSPSFEDVDNKPFIPGRTFAVNNNSKYKDEAWEFLKFLISDEMQASEDLFDFVVNLAAQKQRAKNFLGQTFWYDIYKNEKGRDIKPVTQTDTDHLDKLIGELGMLPYNDPQVSKIIKDAVKEFFSGSKTAEETAKIIQNKISTCLGE